MARSQEVFTDSEGLLIERGLGNGFYCNLEFISKRSYTSEVKLKSYLTTNKSVNLPLLCLQPIFCHACQYELPIKETISEL